MIIKYDNWWKTIFLAPIKIIKSDDEEEEYIYLGESLDDGLIDINE